MCPAFSEATLVLLVQKSALPQPQDSQIYCRMQESKMTTLLSAHSRSWRLTWGLEDFLSQVISTWSDSIIHAVRMHRMWRLHVIYPLRGCMKVQDSGSSEGCLQAFNGLNGPSGNTCATSLDWLCYQSLDIADPDLEASSNTLPTLVSQVHSYACCRKCKIWS